MTEAVATGRIIVDGSAVRGGISQAQSGFASLYSVVRDNWWGLQAIGRSLTEIGSIAGGALGGALKAAADFETGMTAVARTTAKAGEDATASRTAVSGLGKELQNIAEVRPINLKSITDIATSAGSLGIARENVAQFTETIADLVTTTDLTQDSAVRLARTASVFGLAGDEYNKLGSAILTIGVNVGATESEITNMTNRLAPFAQMAGFTAAQTVGLSAAVLSLGPRAEAGATSLQRLFQQMAAAVSTGTSKEFEHLASTLHVSTTELNHMLQAANGNRNALNAIAHSAGISNKELLGIANASISGQKELSSFATIAGTTSERFAELVKSNPAEALNEFIHGMARTGTDAVSTTAALKDLGITEQREIATIAALAGGTKNTANGYLDIGKAMDTATKSFNDGTAVTKAAAAQNNTLNAQWKETSNIFHNAAISFGRDLVPAAKSFNSVIRATAKGVEELPPGLRQVTEALTGGVGLLAASAGGLLLLGARSLLARAAYQQLRTSILQAMVAQRAKMSGDTAEAAGSYRLAFATGLNYKERMAEAAATQRQNQVTALRVRLAQADIEVTQLQLRMIGILAEARAAYANGQLQNVILLGQEYEATNVLVIAKGREIEMISAEIGALEAEQVALNGAKVGTVGLGAVTSAIMGPIGWIIGGLALVTGGLALFGSNADSAADKTDRLKNSSQGYYEALKRVADGEADAARNAVAHDIANQHLVGAGTELNLTTRDLVSAVMDGTGSMQKLINAASGGNTALLELLDSVTDHGKNTVAWWQKSWLIEQGMSTTSIDALNKLISGLTPLKEQYGFATDSMAETASASADLGTSLDDQTGTNKKLSDSLKSITNSTDGAKDSMDQFKVTVSETQQAASRLPGDTLSIAQAQNALADAEETLRTARRAHADGARNVAAAERDIASAQQDVKDKRASLVTAEQKLSTARADARQQLRDDISSQADANDAYLNSLDAVATAQQKLNALQGADHTHDILEATNKLVDARLALVNASVKAGDAETNLAYLQSQGASARDIADAQRSVNQAHQEVKDSTDGVYNAQKALNDVQAAASPAALAKAERDLAAAERDSTRALEKLHETNRKVIQDRNDIKRDKAYKDAQDEVAKATRDLADAQDKAHDSRERLADVRHALKSNKDLRDANLGVQSALLSLAEAQTTYDDDLDTSRGIYVSAATHLDRLRSHFGQLIDKINGPMHDSLVGLDRKFRASGGVADDFGSKLNGLNNKNIKIHVSDKQLITALNHTQDFGNWFDAYMLWLAKGNTRVPPAPPAWAGQGLITGGGDTPYSGSGLITGGVGHAQGAIITGKRYLANGDYMGEAGSEAILPLNDLWGALRPLTAIAAQNAYTNQLLGSYLVRDRTAVVNTATDQSTTHHNKFEINAYTDADAQQIGRDVVWNMKTRL